MASAPLRIMLEPGFVELELMPRAAARDSCLPIRAVISDGERRRELTDELDLDDIGAFLDELPDILDRRRATAELGRYTNGRLGLRLTITERLNRFRVEARVGNQHPVACIGEIDGPTVERIRAGLSAQVEPH